MSLFLFLFLNNQQWKADVRARDGKDKDRMNQVGMKAHIPVDSYYMSVWPQQVSEWANANMPHAACAYKMVCTMEEDIIK